MGATDDFLKKLRSNEMFYNTAGGKRPEMRLPTKMATKFKRITDAPRVTRSPVQPTLKAPTSVDPSKFGYGSMTFRGNDTGGINWKDVGAKAKTLAPYASNIINGLRKPPSVPNPKLDSEVTLSKVNYDSDRANVSSNLRGVTRGAFRTLDENSANAVGLAARGNAVNQMSTINQGEQNQNVGIANQKAGMNAQIRAGNNQKIDQTNQMRVERGVAQQREQSANISNAADKYVGIENEKAKANLDLTKFGIIADMYNKDGVSGAILPRMGTNPLGTEYQNNGSTQAQQTMAEDLLQKSKNRRAEIAKQYKIGNFKYGGKMKYSAGSRFKKLN